MDTVYKYLKEFGFNTENIDIIVNKYPLNTHTPETILKNAQNCNNYFLSLNCSHKDIIKMVKKLPNLYCYTVTGLKEKLIYLKELLSLSEEELTTMILKFPQIFSCSKENIASKINILVSFGISIEKVKKIIKKYPVIISYSEEHLSQRYQEMLDLGYNTTQIKNIIAYLPIFFGLSISNIKQKIVDLTNLGFTYKEVLNMTSLLPSLFSFNIDNIKRKLNFYHQIDLDFIATNFPQRLMQSVELSYARYEFLKSRGIIVNKNNFTILFRQQNKYKEQFGITNQELLLKYPYDFETKVKKK